MHTELKRDNIVTDLRNKPNTGLWRAIVFIVIVVLAFRLLFVEVLSSLHNSVGEKVSLFNFPLLLCSAIGGYCFIRLLDHHFKQTTYSVLRFSFELIYLILSAAIMALAANISDITHGDLITLIESGQIGFAFLSILLLNTIIFYLISIVQYYRQMQQRAIAQKVSERDLAIYQYQQLKRQLDPHFLFNSLSVLDALVESDPERAKEFIHRLSNIYRYMLRSEEHQTISLQNELEFIDSYISLMCVRFENGINYHVETNGVQVDQKHIIPCSLQILAENALKHNAISSAQPLNISLSIYDDHISMRNNLIDLVDNDRATNGVGLRYIEVRFAEFTSYPIEIIHTDTTFEVRLPLLTPIQDEDTNN